MINALNEKLLTFAEVAKRLPSRRKGRPVDVSCIHRWRTRGVQGVRLESLRAGGVWCTSERCLQAFFEAVSVASDDRPRPVTNQQLEAAADAAGRELAERYGI